MQLLNELLLNCLHMDPDRVRASDLEKLAPADWEAFLQIASAQRISALLLFRLKQKGLATALPADIHQKLRNSFSLNTARNLILKSDLRQIVNTLHKANIPVIPLKGAHLAYAVYAEIGLREMSDFDLLVPKNRVQDAVKKIVQLGYGLKTLGETSISSQLHTSQHISQYINSNGTLVEIHWNIGKPDLLVDEDMLWSHANPTKLIGSQMMVLSTEDLIFHLCLHTSFHHNFSFGIRNLLRHC